MPDPQVASFQAELERFQDDPYFRFCYLMCGISDQICGELNQQGLSQQVPPPGCDLSQSTWNRFRNDAESTTILTLVKIATALGKTVTISFHS